MKRLVHFLEKNLQNTHLSPRSRLLKMGLVKAYLFLYNVAQVFGWGSLLYRSLPFIQDQIKATNGLFPARHSKTFYPLINDHLKLVQTAALLEVIHAVLGFVRSNPVITAVQIMRFDLHCSLFHFFT